MVYTNIQERDENFHKEIMEKAKYYGVHIVKENPDNQPPDFCLASDLCSDGRQRRRFKMNIQSLFYTNWDKECDKLLEYLDWCTEKRLITKLHPELILGPLPDFSEWKTAKVFDDWMNRPKYDELFEFKKLYPNWGMEVHTPANLLPIIKSV